MGRRTLSLAIAVSTLVLACLLSMSTGVYAVVILPLIVLPVVASMMAVRAALMHKSAVPGHPTARALEVIAVGGMVAPCLGFLLMFCRLGGGDAVGASCGLAGAREVGNAAGMWAHIWVPAQLGVIVLLARRGRAIATLPWYQAASTSLAVMIAPLLGILAGVATWSEIGPGGAGTAVLVPAAVAAGITLGAWMRGRSFPSSTVLRRLVALALILAVALFAVLWSGPTENVCRSFWTTSTWKMLSVHQLGWSFLLLAGVLLLARDPPFEPA